MKEKLLNARLKKGLSQEELADLIGMSQPNYSRRENGLKNISDVEWTKIAKELGMKKEDIYDDNKTITNSENIHYFNVPDFIMEHMEFLRVQNKELKEKLKKLEV